MPEVFVYTTQTCPHCRTAKDYLSSHGIKYTEMDLNRNEAAAAELASANIMSVPAFKINGEFIVGFDRNRIEELLKFEIVKCPSCGAKLRLPSGKGKLRVTCTNCSSRFEVKS
jgi:glutaredoxin 3